MTEKEFNVSRAQGSLPHGGQPLRQKMRLVLVGWCLNLGGAERVVLDWLNHLDPERFDITLVTFRGGVLETEVPPRRWQRIPRHSYYLESLKKILGDDRGRGWSRVPYFLYRAIRLRALLDRLNPDLVVSHLPQVDALALVAQRWLGAADWPLLCWLHNVPRVPLEPFQERLLRRLYPRADGWVAVSTAVAEAFAAYYGVGSHLIQVQHNLHNMARYRELGSAVAPQWPSSGRRLLAVGRLVAQKNFSLLLEALALLPDRLQWSLLLVGEGPERHNLEAQVAKLGLRERVRLEGEVSNPYPYFKNADLLVSSSLFEGCPGVLIEAMALGTPVVATRSEGGSAEVLGGGQHGRLADPRPQSLAGAIEEVLESLGEWSQRAGEGAAAFDLTRMPLLEDRLWSCAALHQPELREPESKRACSYLEAHLQAGRERARWLPTTTAFQLGRALTLLNPRSLHARVTRALRQGDWTLHRPFVVRPNPMEQPAGTEVERRWSLVLRRLDRLEKSLAYRLGKGLLLLWKGSARHLQVRAELPDPLSLPVAEPREAPCSKKLGVLAPRWLRPALLAEGCHENVEDGGGVLAVLEGESGAEELQNRLERVQGPTVIWLVSGEFPPALQPHLEQAQALFTARSDSAVRLSQKLGRPVEVLAPAVQPRFCSPWADFEGPGMSWSPPSESPPPPHLPAWMDPEWRSSAQELIQRRHLYQHHSLQLRLDRVGEALGLPRTPDPRIALVCCTCRPQNLVRIRRNFLRQSAACELVLLCHGPGFITSLKELETDPRWQPHLVFAEKGLTLGACRQKALERAAELADFLVLMDDDDDYGPHYAHDLVDGLRYSAAGIVGKHSLAIRLLEQKESWLTHPGREYQYAPLFTGAAMALDRGVLEKLACRPLARAWDQAFLRDAWRLGIGQLGLDRFNYCYNRAREHTALEAPVTQLARSGREIPGLTDPAELFV